jgi:hypothetical protein
MSVRGRLLVATAGGAAVAAGLIGLAGPAGASTATTGPTPSAKAAACDKAAWEAKVQGRPSAYHPGAASGDYLWHDSHGFHLRVTHHSTDRAVYTGQIVSSAAMRKDAVRLEGRDSVALSANRKVLSFRFYNYGHTDGVNFHTDCAGTLTVKWLHRDGDRLGRTHVYLGAKSAHPAHVPFVVHRKPVTAS